jgi:hypothetical protein
MGPATFSTLPTRAVTDYEQTTIDHVVWNTKEHIGASVMEATELTASCTGRSVYIAGRRSLFNDCRSYF